MPATKPLSIKQIGDILSTLVPEAFAGAPPDLLPRLSIFLDLLMRWNQRMNLTAIRDPETIVRRHFAESLFAAHHLPATGTLLDLGSGAGFPGLPIQLYRPELAVTLAESQGKKASFLREAIRVLGLRTQVWAARAETLPPAARFDVVTLRAVDEMPTALAVASRLATKTLCILSSSADAARVAAAAPGFHFIQIAQPESESRLLLIGTRTS